MRSWRLSVMKSSNCWYVGFGICSVGYNPLLNHENFMPVAFPCILDIVNMPRSSVRHSVPVEQDAEPLGNDGIACRIVCKYSYNTAVYIESDYIFRVLGINGTRYVYLRIKPGAAYSTQTHIRINRLIQPTHGNAYSITL